MYTRCPSIANIFQVNKIVAFLNFELFMKRFASNWRRLLEGHIAEGNEM